MSVRNLLEEKAGELAAHDGVAVTIMHLHSAVAHLSAELRREFDALVAAVRPAGAAVVAPAAPSEPPEAAVAAAEPADQDVAAAQAADPAAPAPDPAS